MRRGAPIVLLPLLAAVGCSPHDAPPRRPNVLVIGIDTLRADALGCTGAEGNPSPRLDALAATGTLFRDVTSAAPWTLPSFTSLFTGLYPEAHGVTLATDRLAAGHLTLAETLAEAGYDTAAFTGGGHVGNRNGLQDGFAVYDDESATRKFDDRIPRALDWLARRGERPWFLFVHGYDVHSPYAPHERPSPPNGYVPPDDAFADRVLSRLEAGDALDDVAAGDVQVAALTIEHARQRDFRQAVFRWSATLRPTLERQWRRADDFEAGLAWVRANYQAEVREADRSLAPLLDALEASGALDDTVVVVVSDHGEAFMEHERLDHTRVDEEVARVPLIVRPPGGRDDAWPERVDRPVRTIDVLPTVLDLCGLSPAAPVQGRSLLPLLRGEPFPDEPVCCFQHNVGREEPEISIRHLGWKLIVGGVTERRRGKGRLFRVENDPGETRNLIDRRPERAEDLERLLRAVRRRSAAVAALHDPHAAPLDEAARRELIELGYLGQLEPWGGDRDEVDRLGDDAGDAPAEGR